MSISNDLNKKRAYASNSSSPIETSSNSAQNKISKVGQENIHPRLPPITELPCTPQFFYTNETEQTTSTTPMAPPQSSPLSFKASEKLQTSEAIKQITEKAKLDMTAFFNKGKYQNAINAFGTVKPFSKNRPDLLSIIGDCYMKLRNYKEALTYYQSASSLIRGIDSDALEYSSKIAQALQALNQLKLARDNNRKAGYNQSQTSNNNNMPAPLAPVHSAKKITLEKGITSGSLQSQPFQNVQRIVHTSHEKEACVQLNKGKELLDKGSYPQAKEAFLFGLTFDNAPSHIRALLLFNLGFVHSKLDEIKDSIAEYKDALAWATNDDLKAEIIIQYSHVLFKDKQYALVHETLLNSPKTLKNISGDNEGRLLLELALFFESMGNSSEARQVLTNALSNRNNPILNESVKASIYLNLIENLLRSGNAEDNAECIFILELILSCNNIDPDLKGTLCLKLAHVQQKFGKKDDAIHTCKLGLGINGVHNEIRSKLMILIGDLALSDVLSMYLQAFALPGVSTETKAIAENASKKLSDCILSINTNTTNTESNSNT